jgi:hypothetical protein
MRDSENRYIQKDMQNRVLQTLRQAFARFCNSSIVSANQEVSAGTSSPTVFFHPPYMIERQYRPFTFKLQLPKIESVYTCKNRRSKRKKGRRGIYD